jgi:hypothetical protein
MKYYNNFLDNYLYIDLLDEFHTIRDWSDFNRNNSHMLEFYGELPKLKKVREYLHSKKCIEWIEKELKIDGLVVDVCGTGEGVSLMESGDHLDPHIDFNWNSRIKMYRAVNLTIYFGNCQGGEFHVWDDNKENIIFEQLPKHNSAILLQHSESKSHGVKPVTHGRRYAIRQFYYRSKAVAKNPHQSLYWFNPEKQMPTNS